MRDEEKNILRAKVNADIVALQKQITALEEQAQPLGRDCCMDEITLSEVLTEQEVTRKILDASILRLGKLHNALLRIDTPMFGICSECEEEIGIGRMSIRPESTRCVACANASS